MLNFKCSNCQNDIQSEEQFIGDMVQCPFCIGLQVVPDPMLPPRTEYNGYQIIRTLGTSILWTTYEVTQQPHNLALCIPTSFFLKRITDFQGFANRVRKIGSINKPELPSLIDQHSDPGNEYFLFDYQDAAFKIRHFIANEPLDPNNALMVVRKIATTLSQLWEENGILHQCLIPDHISMTTDIKIRIHNFGLSEYFLQDQQLLEHGFNIWDYKYLSPEFITDGVANTPSCDIFSLGGILFLLCTGHDPHENYSPENITSAPVPALSDFLTEFPESLSVLLQMMMAQNPESRFSSWQEVIKHIDSILTSHATTSDIYYFNSQPNQTNYHEPVGLSAGDLTQSISKPSSADTASQVSKLTRTKRVRPISKQNLSTMNKKWKGDKSQPIPKNKQKAPVGTIVFFSVLFTIALIISIVIIVTSNKKKTVKHRTKSYSTNTSENKDVYASQMELLKKSGYVPPATNETSLPEQQAKPKTITRKPAASNSASSISTKLLAIDEYHLNNPSKTREVLIRYEALMKEAVEKKKFTLVDRIQEKINLLPELPAETANTSTGNPKVDEVIATIKKQILPLLKSAKYDEALTILLEYNGELANESRKQRLDLAEDIKARIAKIESGELAAGATEPTQAKPEEKNPVDTLKKVAEQFAPSLFNGKFSEGKAKLEMAENMAAPGMIKTQLADWLQQVKNYEKLKPELEKNSTADPIINAPENQQMMEKAYILQGCLYKDKEQFVKAKQAFMKLPYYLGETFVVKMEQSMNE